MVLTGVSKDFRNGLVVLAGEVREPNRDVELTFSWPVELAEDVYVGPEPFMAALAVPALHRRCDLRTELPTSPTLLRGLHRVQGTFRSWYPNEFVECAVHAPVRSDPIESGAARMGAFFSMGVDSFDTAIQHTGFPAPWNPPLTDLVLMRGLEFPLEGSEGLVEVELAARDAATALGLNLIVGESNVRTLYPISWAQFHHGTALAATALTLSRRFGVFLIPSSVTPARAQPWGGMPILEESCSTEWCRISTDASETSRADKVHRSIASHPVALRYLRICTANRGGGFNCGCCAKCLRTMLLLEAAGALENAETLPRQLPADFWRSYTPNQTIGMEAALRIARETGGRARELIPHLERAIGRTRERNALRSWLEVSPLRGLLPTIRRLRASLRGKFHP